MELAIGILIPLEADYVLEPEVYYGNELTGIYFQSSDEEYGRITFENLDALKVCRGENLPYPDNWLEGQDFCWVYKVDNSNWKKERYKYEKENYGDSYEFGGNVDEMLSDFSHYIFKFHDQFIEVIARGFWYEKDITSLIKKPLQKGHPFLELDNSKNEKLEAHTLSCQIRRNKKSKEELIKNAELCSQKLIEFALELEGEPTINHSLMLFYRNNKLITNLIGSFGNEIVAFDKIANYDDVRPHIETYMKEVYERRKEAGK